MSILQLPEQQLKSLAGTVTSSDLATLAQIVRGTEANKHTSRAHTKVRGDISGGGKKPWKQKGTGRARVGDNRSPVWRGGGTTFGPRKDRNHSVVLTQSMRTKALRIAVNMKANDQAIWVTDQLPTDGKTKSLQALIPVELTKKRVIVLLDEPTAAVTQASRNLPFVTTRLATQVAAREVLVAGAIIGTTSSIKALDQRLSAKAVA